MESLDQQIKKKAIISGLILGIIILVLTIISFYLITAGSSSFLVILVSPFVFAIVMPIVAAIVLSYNLRKRIGGFWIFRQATTGIFIMFLVSFVVLSIGRDLIFARFIEPNMAQKTETAMISATKTMLKQQNVNQSQIDEKINEIKQKSVDQNNVGIGTIILNYAIALIFLFVFALAFAALLKKNPPEYLTQADSVQ